MHNRKHEIYQKPLLNLVLRTVSDTICNSLSFSDQYIHEMDTMLLKQNKLIMKLREECKKEAINLEKTVKKYRSVRSVYLFNMQPHIYSKILLKFTYLAIHCLKMGKQIFSMTECSKLTMAVLFIL